MTRKILGALAAVALSSMPFVASAKPNALGPGQFLPQNVPRVEVKPSWLIMRQQASNGNGQNSKDNGDVTGPGQKARVDPSLKGPLNDVNPGGTESEDVPASARPHPVR